MFTDLIKIVLNIVEKSIVLHRVYTAIFFTPTPNTSPVLGPHTPTEEGEGMEREGPPRVVSHPNVRNLKK